MLKRYVAIIIFIVTIGFATTSPTELIQHVGEQVLVDYTRPLVCAFGAGLNSGLYHTANAHNPGGFDLILSAMYIPIPEANKTYHYKVPGLTINTTTQQLDTVWFEGTAHTIFGDTLPTIVYQGQDTIAIPPVLPKGTGFSFLPMVMPQLSVGIYYGAEILIRFIPKFKIPSLGEKIGFWAIGLKEDITKMPVPILQNLPVDIAIQGAYQNLQIGDIITTTALNFNIHTSKKFSVITPYLGVGWEDTKFRFKYDFSYNKPDPNIPNQTISDTIRIDKTISADNKFRLVAGFSLKFGPILLNSAYNFAKNRVISGSLGISIR